MRTALAFAAPALVMALAGCGGGGQQAAAISGSEPTPRSELTVAVAEFAEVAADGTAVTAIDAARRDGIGMPADARGSSAYDRQLAAAAAPRRAAAPLAPPSGPSAAAPDAATAALLDDDQAVTIGG